MPRSRGEMHNIHSEDHVGQGRPLHWYANLVAKELWMVKWLDLGDDRLRGLPPLVIVRLARSKGATRNRRMQWLLESHGKARITEIMEVLDEQAQAHAMHKLRYPDPPRKTRYRSWYELLRAV